MQMKAMRKSRLGLAVGAALGTACLAPATSFGRAVDTYTATISSSSGGDTLLFPLYTTVNAATGLPEGTPAAPATTSFSVTNTSGQQTIAAKIRFREQVHSMDVLDFIVVLSPYDKFNFWVHQNPGDPTPTMSWDDNSCVVGPTPTVDANGLKNQVFPSHGHAFHVDTDAQMSVGHVEMLGMADLEYACVDSNGKAPPKGTACGGSYDNYLADAAAHDATGKPADCDLLTKALGNADNVYSLNSASSLADVGNVLVGRYVIDNGITLADGSFHIGIEGGSDAISIQSSDLTVVSDGTAADNCPEALPPGSDPDGYYTPVRKCVHISSQTSKKCTDTGNCTSLYAWDQLDWDHPHLAELRYFSGFQYALTADNVAGDWSNNPVNDVGVDWVLSFPDKYAYLDYVNPTGPTTSCESSTDTDPGWCLLASPRSWRDVASFPQYPDGYEFAYGYPYVWTFDLTRDLCLGTGNVLAWDTEEQESSSTVSVSPGTGPELNICNELTVLSLAPTDQVSTIKPSVIQMNVTDNADPLKDISRLVVSFENLSSVLGWGRLDLDWNRYWAVCIDPDQTQCFTIGDAVSGLIFTTRATSSPTDQNGSLTDLQKNVGDVIPPH
jgi:hypothetical protein